MDCCIFDGAKRSASHSWNHRPRYPEKLSVIIESYLDKFYRSYDKYPAFISGLFALFSISLSKHHDPVLLIPLLCLVLPFLLRQRKKLFCLILPMCLILYLFGKYNQPRFYSPTESIQGTAYFSPSEIKPYSSPFHRSFMVTGTISCFIKEEKKIASGIPCSIHLPIHDRRLSIDHDYLLEGTLQKTESRFIFKPDKNKLWKKVEGTYNFAEIRFRAKRACAHWIRSHISDKKAGNFLIALSTGNLEDRLLRFEFSRLGLQHILAISGFHFGMFALFIGFLLKRILKEKLALSCLLICLIFYFLFLGPSPSILRAFVAITLYILGCLLGITPSGINALGIGLWVELLLYPSCPYHLGFQLSFLSTAAILFLTPLMIKYLELIFPKKSMQTIQTFSLRAKTVYALCCFFKGSLALNLAVHSVMIPVCLYHFHKFPLMSLFCNLIFPAGITISLFLLFMSCLVCFLPPIASFIFLCNQSFTSYVLHLVSEFPPFFDIYLYAIELPLWLLFTFLTMVFLKNLYLEHEEYPFIHR